MALRRARGHACNPMPVEPPSTRTRCITTSALYVPWTLLQTLFGRLQREGRDLPRAKIETSSIQIRLQRLNWMPTAEAECSMNTCRICTRVEFSHVSAGKFLRELEMCKFEMSTLCCARMMSGVVRDASWHNCFRVFARRYNGAEPRRSSDAENSLFIIYKGSTPRLSPLVVSSGRVDECRQCVSALPSKNVNNEKGDSEPYSNE